ncbi:hypothetical protein AUEXF2481DRAFT_399802 [Aureobasidium subglaciale EXF-2481]|uniref:Uncharacterized protein n=1 Tax=Aureobasidium subglaciale (strain EXF-2481) TaxID=1043005 RepID=A0A074YN69_AURSE|nr:uncharacterized protein AUEXF2481DRAFT_399802 [Aureobasidium subglaciale EXF-2481]KEQ99105.1 hypothetical protein AUEXF2481DRAFT_399802 [Aureobasidium subglaciale EXF-2481]
MKLELLHLPFEILDQIIHFTIPDPHYLAYPASHSCTKTLLSLSRVSKFTFQTARKLLYTHCLYIDAPWRLGSLVTALSHSNSTIPLSCPRNLYLSPFSGPTIRNREIVTNITVLFTILGPYLKRLVINIPLRSHYPEDDRTETLRPLLRQGFVKLVELEEFASVRDELYLAYWNPAFNHIPMIEEDEDEDNDDDDEDQEDHTITDFFPSYWPKLKHLALYNSVFDTTFMDALARMPLLNTVVLSRRDFGDDEDDWLQLWNAKVGARVEITFIESTDVELEAGIKKLTFTDLPPHRAVDTSLGVWMCALYTPEDGDAIGDVQEWTLKRMLDGSLWSSSELEKLATQAPLHCL